MREQSFSNCGYETVNGNCWVVSVILCRVSSLFNLEIYSLTTQVITTTFNEQQSFNAVDDRFYFENVHSYNEQNGHFAINLCFPNIPYLG